MIIIYIDIVVMISARALSQNKYNLKIRLRFFQHFIGLSGHRGDTKTQSKRKLVTETIQLFTFYNLYNDAHGT